MLLSRFRRIAAPALAALAASGAAWAAVEVPQYRPLGASEALVEPGNPGADYSANPPSLGGLTLLATIPAPAAPRSRVEIYANCTAGLSVVLDDQAGASTPTVVPVAGPASNGGQGGSYVTTAHTGRIRVYSSSPSCQMAARVW